MECGLRRQGDYWYLYIGKDLREKLQWEKGDKLEISVASESSRVRVRKHQGGVRAWPLYNNGRISITSAIRKLGLVGAELELPYYTLTGVLVVDFTVLENAE
jgi:hypothetical protein